jgi:hypothetical protein
MTKNTIYRTVPVIPNASTLKKSHAQSVSQWIVILGLGRTAASGLGAVVLPGGELAEPSKNGSRLHEVAALQPLMNCNVMGNILGQIARAWPRFQAPYLPEFVGESRRYLFGHHAVASTFTQLPQLFDEARRQNAHQELRELLRAVIDVVEWRQDKDSPKKGEAFIQLYPLPNLLAPSGVNRDADSSSGCHEWLPILPIRRTCLKAWGEWSLAPKHLESFMFSTEVSARLENAGPCPLLPWLLSIHCDGGQGWQLPESSVSLS